MLLLSSEPTNSCFRHHPKLFMFKTEPDTDCMALLNQTAFVSLLRLEDWIHEHNMPYSWVHILNSNHLSFLISLVFFCIYFTLYLSLRHWTALPRLIPNQTKPKTNEKWHQYNALYCITKTQHIQIQ